MSSPKSSPLEYNPETGLFSREGRVLRARGATGYVYVRYGGKTIAAHRLAWFLTYGNWPDVVDHKNGVRADNRIANLRDVDDAGNAQNQKHRSSLPGAHFHKPSGLWKSSICIRRRQVHLGYYPSAEHASEMYLLAKDMVHGEQEERNAEVV